MGVKHQAAGLFRIWLADMLYDIADRLAGVGRDERGVFADSECIDVNDLYSRHGFRVTKTDGEPGHVTSSHLGERITFMREELDEFIEAARKQDMEGMADALIDLVYVAKGTAVIMKLPWGELWEDVHFCNMQKRRGTNAKRSDIAEDLVKPPGWTPPNTMGILLAYGYDPTKWFERGASGQPIFKGNKE